jgi:hypothetical protein
MKILVECFTDTLFITLLGHKCVADHSSIGNVARRMKTKFIGELVLGIVDNDVNKPLYFDEFQEIKSSHTVSFLKHKTNKQRYLIFLKQDIEDFIAHSAKEAKVKNIVIAKTSKVSDNRKIVAFLNDIIGENPSSVSFLNACINEAAKAK